MKMRPDGRLELFLSHPERSEGTRMPELHNGSQIFKKWSEMVLCCWGFHKNVSRETSFCNRAAVPVLNAVRSRQGALTAIT